MTIDCCASGRHHLQCYKAPQCYSPFIIDIWLSIEHSSDLYHWIKIMSQWINTDGFDDVFQATKIHQTSYKSRWRSTFESQLSIRAIEYLKLSAVIQISIWPGERHCAVSQNTHTHTNSTCHLHNTTKSERPLAVSMYSCASSFQPLQYRMWRSLARSPIFIHYYVWAFELSPVLTSVRYAPTALCRVHFIRKLFTALHHATYMRFEKMNLCHLRSTMQAKAGEETDDWPGGPDRWRLAVALQTACN